MITTATLRDATRWDELVDDLGLAGLVRHGLRHTALTRMADAGVELHLLQRVAGHQDPAVTSRYLHPDHQAVLDVGAAYARWWAQIRAQLPGAEASRGWAGGRMNAALIRCDNPTLTCRLADLNSRPLDPQTSAACPRTSTDVHFSLKIRILHLGAFRWTNPNGGQNGGQTHSQTK